MILICTQIYKSRHDYVDSGLGGGRGFTTKSIWDLLEKEALALLQGSLAWNQVHTPLPDIWARPRFRGFPDGQQRKSWGTV